MAPRTQDFDPEEAGDQPDAVLTASEFLDHELKRLGLDQQKLADLTGVSRQTINAIVRGRQPISRAMSVKLGEVFDQPADFWLREQFRRASQRISEPEPQDVVLQVPQGLGQPGQASPAQGVPSSVLSDRQIIDAIRENTISIEPFDLHNVRAASLDMTLGDVDTGAKFWKDEDSDGQTIEIDRFGCVHAWTREKITLPGHMLARVGPTATLSHLGLFLGHGLQVDPGFDGQLAFSLFNASPKPMRLSIGQVVLSLEIVTLGGQVTNPMEAAGNRADFARRANEQFAENDLLSRVRQHIEPHLKTETDPANRTIFCRVKGTDIVSNDADAEGAREKCIEKCLKIVKSESDNIRRGHAPIGHYDALAQLFGALHLDKQCMDLILRDLEMVSFGGGSATIADRDGREITIDYPDGGNIVRVADLAGPMQLNVNPLILIHHLITGGDTGPLPLNMP